MFDDLGLGVRLNFDDNMTERIGPLIRELERLRRSAQMTSNSFSQMSNFNPYSTQRRRDLQDYNTAMGTLGGVLNAVSAGFIGATASAGALQRATNRMQFMGNFNQMDRQLLRTQRMLSSMGYGMTDLQRKTSNVQAYDLLDRRLKDLNDRLRFTKKGLTEMMQSPDAGKFAKEIALAQASILAYQNQMREVGDMRLKLAETHGLGITTGNVSGRDTLYERPQSNGEAFRNQMTGAFMTDMALASTLAYNSLGKLEKQLVDTNLTTDEFKRETKKMATQLQTMGMTLTPTVSLVSALALGGIGLVANNFEKPQAQFAGQTLMSTQEAREYNVASKNTWQNASGATYADSSRMYSTMHNAGITNTSDMNTIANGAWEISYSQGTDALETMNSVLAISDKHNLSYEDSLNVLSVALKNTNGDLEESTQLALENASAFMDAEGKWRNAFDTISEANNSGGIVRLVNGFKGLGNVLETVWNYGMKNLVGGFGDLVSNVSSLTASFLEANPAIAKFAGLLLGGILMFGLLAPPILLVTGFLLKFKSVIGGVALAATALNRGGLALLGAQSNMVAQRIHAVTVALARFPQILMTAFLPALYNIVRAIPILLWNMAKLNPVMTMLTVGAIAFSKNWFGFGDTVRGVFNSIKDTWNGAKNLVSTGLGGAELDLSASSNVENVIAKTMASAQIGKKVLGSIFTGQELKFSDGEVNLMQQLGIEGVLQGIATAGNAVKNFIDGFMNGLRLVYDTAKSIGTALWETIQPVVDKISGLFSGMFSSGGEGGVAGIISSATGSNDTMKNLGMMAGVALTSLLGFKLLAPLFSGLWKTIAKNPFNMLAQNANRARSAVSNIVRGGNATAGNAMGGNATGNRGGIITRTASNVVGAITGRNARNTASAVEENRRNAIAGATGTRALANGQYASTVRDRNGNVTGSLIRNSTPPMNAEQQRRANILATNSNARMRGYNIGNDTALRRGNQPDNLRNSGMLNRNGTYNGSNPNLQGQQVHARQQGRLSRALFGQAYDVHGQDGRRTTINRQGGLLRRQGSDTRVSERSAIRDRASDMATTARQRVQSAGTSALRTARQAGGAIMNTPGAQRIAQAGRAITVPVRYVNQRIVTPVIRPLRSTASWVTQRLQTAGLIRQGQQAGNQSGSRFTRAFRASTRALGSGASMFGGVVRSASRAGGQAGRGMLGGMRFISGGIGKLFGAGLRAIPILGWALMAWDIISAIFSNWSAITNGAKKAWNWIKTDGINALQSAWESIKSGAGVAWDWIKSKAGEAWNWILQNGATMAGTIASNIISFIGQAFSTILGLALSAIAWILSDGIAMAVNLGGQIFSLVGKAFTDLVGWAVGKFWEIVGLVAGVGLAIGNAILNGIKSALAGVGEWVAGIVGGAVNGAISLWNKAKGAFSGGGGGSAGTTKANTGGAGSGTRGGGGSSSPTRAYARGGIINSPHVGLVGEAGPEAIIPLSGNQRNRAQMLFTQVAGTLGMKVEKVSEKNTSISQIAGNSSVDINKTAYSTNVTQTPITTTTAMGTTHNVTDTKNTVNTVVGNTNSSTNSVNNVSNNLRNLFSAGNMDNSNTQNVNNANNPLDVSNSNVNNVNSSVKESNVNNYANVLGTITNLFKSSKGAVSNFTAQNTYNSYNTLNKDVTLNSNESTNNNVISTAIQSLMETMRTYLVTSKPVTNLFGGSNDEKVQVMQDNRTQNGNNLLTSITEMLTVLKPQSVPISQITQPTNNYTESVVNSSSNANSISLGDLFNTLTKSVSNWIGGSYRESNAHSNSLSGYSNYSASNLSSSSSSNVSSLDLLSKVVNSFTDIIQQVRNYKSETFSSRFMTAKAESNVVNENSPTLTNAGGSRSIYNNNNTNSIINKYTDGVTHSGKNVVNSNYNFSTQLSRNYMSGSNYDVVNNPLRVPFQQHSMDSSYVEKQMQEKGIASVFATASTIDRFTDNNHLQDYSLSSSFTDSRNRELIANNHSTNTTHDTVSVMREALRNFITTNNISTSSTSDRTYRGDVSEDNSITINNVILQFPQGTHPVTKQEAEKLVSRFAKELQQLMKQERLRSGGKNLTIEELLLNL